MPTVKFIKENKEIEVPEGANLRKEAKNAGINLYAGGAGMVASIRDVMLNCHGFGLCGLCRVKLTKGIENVNSMGMVEKTRFHCPVPDPLPCMAYIGNEEDMRLACRTTVHGNIEVETVPALNLFGENFFS